MNDEKQEELEIKLPTGRVLVIELAPGDMGVRIYTKDESPMFVIPISTSSVDVIVPFDLGPAEAEGESQ